MHGDEPDAENVPGRHGVGAVVVVVDVVDVVDVVVVVVVGEPDGAGQQLAATTAAIVVVTNASLKERVPVPISACSLPGSLPRSLPQSILAGGNRQASSNGETPRPQLLTSLRPRQDSNPRPSG